jgi:hypothetical protein
MSTPTITPENVPAGYMMDGKGRLVPESLVSDIDKLRNQTVLELVDAAGTLATTLREFKEQAFGDIAAFIETSAEAYGAKVGGKKGNVTLYSYDGRFKVVRQMADQIRFDERLMAAKALIDECITEWTEGSRDEIKVLINDAFRVDQQGHVSANRVLGLQRLAITNPKWATAMRAIKDSIQIVGSSSYVRIYERIGDSDQYRAIVLDLAAA